MLRSSSRNYIKLVEILVYRPESLERERKILMIQFSIVQGVLRSVRSDSLTRRSVIVIAHRLAYFLIIID